MADQAPNPKPAPELSAAVGAKHDWLTQQSRPLCCLCHEPTPITLTSPVIVALRVAEGRILFRLAEPWCAGCATLAYGVDGFRDYPLTPGAR